MTSSWHLPHWRAVSVIEQPKFGMYLILPNSPMHYFQWTVLGRRGRAGLNALCPVAGEHKLEPGRVTTLCRVTEMTVRGTIFRASCVVKASVQVRYRLAIESLHSANVVVTYGASDCHYYNLQCHQWRQSWHHDYSLFSVTIKPTQSSHYTMGSLKTGGLSMRGI